MSNPPKKNRRAMPRFKAWVACSVLPQCSDKDFHKQAILGYVEDFNREAIALLLPSNETYGIDASNIGNEVQLTLALPAGYVRLSATLVRNSPDDSGKSLFVFKIHRSMERSRYDDYLDSLEWE